MGRRGLRDARSIARMWGFVALALATMSFVQAYGFVKAGATLSTSTPIEACNLASSDEYALDDQPDSARAAIEDLTGLARLDLRARPVTIKATVQGVVLTTESGRKFRLSRQSVVRLRQRFLPLIATAIDDCTPNGEVESYVLLLGKAGLADLKKIVNQSRVYCTSQMKERPLPGSTS